MDDEYVDSADMAELALSQAVDEHIDSSKEIINTIETLERQVKSWDTEDIRILKRWILEMRTLLQKHFQVQIENFMNMKVIPSGKVPDQLRKPYKIVATDKKGYALYGPEMDKISHITKIAEHFQRQAALKNAGKK